MFFLNACSCPVLPVPADSVCLQTTFHSFLRCSGGDRSFSLPLSVFPSLHFPPLFLNSFSLPISPFFELPYLPLASGVGSIRGVFSFSVGTRSHAALVSALSRSLLLWMLPWSHCRGVIKSILRKNVQHLFRLCSDKMKLAGWGMQKFSFILYKCVIWSALMLFPLLYTCIIRTLWSQKVACLHF